MASKGTDGRTRRRWSAARKAAILAAPSGPGTTPSAIARRHALSPGLLHRWRRGWAPQPGPVPPRFAEVIVDAGSPRDTAIENETPALRLRAPVATRAETLVAILGAPRGSR